MTPFAVSPLSDEPRIRGYLLTDAAYAAYALADLEPPYSASATWTVATRDAVIEGLALLYDALEPPALFLMGSLPAAEALLRQPIGPERVLFMCQPHLIPAVRTAYNVGATSEMLRMRLAPAGFSPAHPDRSPTPRRLTASDVPAMRRLLVEAAAHDERALDDIAFTPRMVETGIYCGIESGSALIAMAGKHVIAPRADLAALCLTWACRPSTSTSGATMPPPCACTGASGSRRSPRSWRASRRSGEGVC